ncbi:sugar O-acetyltransferase [Fluctibacter halophilus]|uniref:sugar O-acetyltransferase n=1 Tax=Fluctibacter halophilus TaxID=226011 RepID=UPI002B4BC0FC|nr:sugar O-acetyltransferase [Aestuariibacter halophilus]
MSEQAQKQARGEWYVASDKPLRQARLRAKTLCHRFNGLSPEDSNARGRVLKQLLPYAKKPHIEAPFYCDYGDRIVAPHGVFLNHGVIILDAAPVTFGDNVLIGPGVIIATVTHPKDAGQRAQGLEQAKPVTIGDNVWIGMGAKILPGVTIGEGAIIAAGAVVTQDVAAGKTAMGVPARAQP